MLPNYQNQLNGSFRLWLDHTLCSAGGFVNTTGTFYSTNDPNFSAYQIYGTAFRQFVADSSINGAIICSGVNDVGNGIWNEVEMFWSDDPNFWNGTTGSLLSVDFERGRVITDYELDEPVIGSFAFKKWNTYYNYLDEVSLLIDTAFQIQSPIYQATGALSWDAQPIPAIYIQNNYQENNPWAFGGTDLSINDINLILLTNNSYELDATISLLANASKSYITLIPVAQMPYDSLGGLKTGYYNYNTLCAQQPANQLIYVESVKVSKFPANLNKEVGKGIKGAFVDFRLSFQRQPRKYTR